MRFLLVLIVIAAIIGFFTVPSAEKFDNYLVKKGKDTGVCTTANSKRYTSYKVFCIEYVDYCDPASDNKILKALDLTKTHTDKYIGIFGMFFKL